MKAKTSYFYSLKTPVSKIYIVLLDISFPNTESRAYSFLYFFQILLKTFFPDQLYQAQFLQ